MSTSTIINLVRWRVRDLATCFHACRLPPIDEEPDCCISTGQESKKKMVFDPIGERRRRETNRRKIRKKKRDNERVSLESCKQTRNSKRSEDGMGESRMSSRFDEEEYIVFCFREDGEIHVVKERRSSEASHAQIDRPKRRSRAMNHMKSDEGAPEITSKQSHANVDLVVTSANVEGGSNVVKAEWPPDEIKEINHNGIRENKTLSSLLSAAESSDSNQSDASSGSFAFPVLGWEWIGSPVHMPNPEEQKHKARGVRLHCCTF